MSKKTLVLGASDNPARYSNLAIQRLRRKEHPVVAIGKRESVVDDVQIGINKTDWKDIDTVIFYLNPVNQRQYYEYILSLKPKRIIFSQGAENDELARAAKENGIEVMEACPLVLLSTGQY
jgi:predicted CoA-binding protein